jgi:hypothetical protein
MKYEGRARHVRFAGTRARWQEWSRSCSAIDFSWNSDPLKTSKREFAIIGEQLMGPTTTAERIEFMRTRSPRQR